MKSCTPLWRKTHFEVKMLKTPGVRTTFGSWDVEKVHAVVARSTFPSQNVQNTRGSDHFWKLRCRKSARRCGAKHISKSECAKHTILGPLLEVEMSKKCTPLWREAHFEVKMYKTHQVRTTFGSWDVEKVHAVVARSTFPSPNVQNTTCSRHFWRFRCRKSARRCGAKHISSQNVQSTPFSDHFGSWDVEKVHAVVARSTFRSQNVKNTRGSDHFWKLRCWKSARRCGAKHISKSKCTKHTILGPLLEVEMSKKCTPLWREAHFQVRMYKTHHSRTTFGSSDVVSRCRRKGLWTLSKVSKTWGFCSIFNYNHHYTTLHSNTLHYTTTTTTPSLHSTTLHSTTLHYTQLHSITLNYTTLHYTTLHYTTLHYTTLHYTTLHYITPHYTTFHYTTLHNTTLHYTPLHSTTLYTLHYITLQLQLHNCTTTLHYTPLHYTTLHYIPLHFTTLHNTTLHWMTLHHR